MTPGEGGAADKANRRLPWNGAAGPGCQAATVADERRETKIGATRWRKSNVLMQGGPTDGKRKPATVWVAGWRPGEGREGLLYFS